jgi:hypothetical protein
VDREQWRTSVREGIDGRVAVEQDRSGMTRILIAPAAGGNSVIVTARLPFDSSELVNFLGAPTTGSYREIALDGDGGSQNLRYQVSTDRARLEILLAEGMTPATLRIDDVEVVQRPAARALAAPSSGWNYPVPVAVLMGDSRTELWQRQVVVLEGSQGRSLLVGVTTSTVARPRGTARHLLDGDPYLLGAVVLVAR